jgi:hypothetical protein
MAGRMSRSSVDKEQTVSWNNVQHKHVTAQPIRPRTGTFAEGRKSPDSSVTYLNHNWKVKSRENNTISNKYAVECDSGKAMSITSKGFEQFTVYFLYLYLGCLNPK